jgi:hypothetical protein
MKRTSFPPTPAVLKAIRMTEKEATESPRRASILAGRYLRMLAFERRYNHGDIRGRGMKWFSPSGKMFEGSNVDVLAYALAE